MTLEEIPYDVKIKILNNVWCVKCSSVTGVANISVSKEKSDLVIKGISTRCGGPVARVIERNV